MEWALPPLETGCTGERVRFPPAEVRVTSLGGAGAAGKRGEGGPALLPLPWRLTEEEDLLLPLILTNPKQKNTQKYGERMHSTFIKR